MKNKNKTRKLMIEDKNEKNWTSIDEESLDRPADELKKGRRPHAVSVFHA